MFVVESEKCDGCGSCVDVCPSGSIELKGGISVINPEDCSECGSCEAECPNQAISEV